MRYCQYCGKQLEYLRGGGCGGRGALYGCEACDRLFMQSTGGFMPTPEGETLSPVDGSYKEYKKVHPEIL